MKMFRNRVTTTFLCVLISIILSTFTANAKSKLSASEVNQLFVGKVWVGPQGEFLFTKDGRYSYFHCVASNNYPYGLRGTWDYKMTSKGKFIGETTNYTFYKTKKGYKYYHSRTGNLNTATPTDRTTFDCSSF